MDTLPKLFDWVEDASRTDFYKNWGETRPGLFYPATSAARRLIYENPYL